MTELWDILDSQGQPTGRTMSKDRREVGALRQVVHVCLFDDSGRMLIQKRAAGKDIWPNLWDVSVAGSVIAGETPREAAIRETREELGLDIDLGDRRPNFTLDYPEGFDHFFLVTDVKVDASALVLATREVAEVRWASLAEILDLHAAGEFAPVRRAALRFIFDLAGRHSILDGGDRVEG
jgi:isopentenyldiphosphate isomerase